MLTYRLLKAAAWLAQRLPRSVSYALAWAGGWLACQMAGEARAALRQNLRHVLGPDAPAGIVDRAVLGAFRTSAYNYVDMFRIPLVSPQALLARTTVHHGERMLDAWQAGKGVIVVTAHFGNFDLLAQASQAYDIPVVALAEKLNPPELYDFIVGLRASHGLRIVPVDKGALREVVRTLKTGGVLAMAGDRDLQGRGVPTPFFDAEAPLPAGPVELAVDTGAVLLPTFGIRRPGGRYEIFYEEPLALQRQRTPEAGAHNRRLLAAVMERFIGAQPDQWMVFEPIWKTPAEPVEKAQAR